MRDQLIADQENLLNTYRCLFGTDTDVVPGGCDNPDTIVPGAAPQNPTQNDLDIRDGLIQSQEALLNVYRCQHNIDTQLVPGGCPDQPEDAPPAAGAVALVSYRSGSCALKRDQTITCWHEDFGDSVPVPSGQFESIQSSRGSSGFCGLRTDKFITCWNWDWQWVEGKKALVLNEGVLPKGEFTGIGVLGFYMCGLRADQSIACWAGDIIGGNSEELEVPNGKFTDVKGLSAYSSETVCGLRVDQSMACWVWERTQNENGDTSFSLTELDVPTGQFIDIKGSDSWCAVRIDQSIICWGWENQNRSHIELDLPDSQLTDVTFVVQDSFWCGLRADLVVTCWDWWVSQGNAGGSNVPQVWSLPDGEFDLVTHIGGLIFCGQRIGLIIACWSWVDERDDEGNRLFELEDLPDEQFTSVFRTTYHSFWCGLRSDQTVVCWPESSVPSDWIDARLADGQIIAIEFRVRGEGGEHWCALRNDGELICAAAQAGDAYG